MRKLNTISYRKIFALTAIVAVLFIGSTHAVSAADSSTIKNLFSCSLTSGNLVTCATYGLGVVIQEILILFVQLGGLITRIALQVNDHIFDSPYIQTGFSVTLAIANLGFVLGIIVIALATILRSQSYGMKQLLWKLVVMAILVNFGLVIARPIVSTSDSLTQYFINAVGGGNGYDGLVNNLTGTFKPGALLAPPSTGTTLTSIGCNILGAGGLFSPVVSTCQQLASLISQKTGVGNISPPDSFTQTLMGLVLATLLTGFVAIVMLTLGILLVLRYVALGLLLVILPFAWLAWVFPQFKSWFNKWWSEFIRWTFFPPAVLFFIYLALTVISNQKYVGDATVPANGVDGILGGLALSTGVAPLVTQVATEFIFIALMVGGVMMAASLSGKAGAVVVDGAKSASKWIGGYVGRRSKQAATAPLRSERTRAWAARLQQPDRNPLARWTGRLVMGTAIAGGESAAKAAAKDIEGDTPDQNRQKIATTAYAPKRIARIEKAIKDNKVKEFTDEENEKYFGKSKEAEYKRYGEWGEKIYREGREKSGLEMRDLLKEEGVLSSELAAQHKAAENKATGAPTNPDDWREAAATEDKLRTNRKKQDGLRKKQAADDPETLASAFQSGSQQREARQKAEKAGKPLPASITIDQASLKQMQRGIVRSMAEGFSPSNASALINQLSKKNNLGQLEEVIKELKRDDPAEFAKMKDALLKNATLVRWFKKNSGKSLIKYKELFDITDDEERNVAGR